MRFSGRLVIITALAVSVLLVSNIIASKPLMMPFELPFEFLGSSAIVFSVSVICFPIGYIISDVLTEVYGFRVARGVIWLGFACNLLMVLLFWVAISIPGAPFFAESTVPGVPDQEAYSAVLGSARWLLVGSFAAYVVGEFSNATVMVLLKNATGGRHLWLRTISSTVVGQGIDSILFYAIAFGVSGLWGWDQAIGGAITAWIIKILYEVAATPLTYWVVGWLKRVEVMDIYDAPHSLNPFGVFGDDDGDSYNAAQQPA